jgi:8-oxo-dGTP pyrophosphatase MutT (NUDIX family)
MPIQPWPLVSSQPLHQYRIFKTRSDRVISPRTKKEHEVVIVECCSWVAILALTPENQVVLTEQYRHGLRETALEIPGGMMDANESPAEAGARELLEETGYAGNPPRLLGKVHPNPAYQTNTCYTVLILNAKPVAKPTLDVAEDIGVRVVDENEFERMIIDGRITSGMVVVADLWRRIWRSGQIPS